MIVHYFSFGERKIVVTKREKVSKYRENGFRLCARNESLHVILFSKSTQNSFFFEKK